MKIRFIVATIIILFSSCSYYDPASDWLSKTVSKDVVETIIDYTVNFKQRYGESDSTHNWGFHELGSTNYNETRAVVKPDDNFLIINNNCELQLREDIIKIIEQGTIPIYPGFPTSDGKYRYIKNNQIIIKNNLQDVINDIALNKKVVLAGDVTDDEIWYVSKWFREHHYDNPDTVPNMTEFFIQSISQDVDRDGGNSSINYIYTFRSDTPVDKIDNNGWIDEEWKNKQILLFKNGQQIYIESKENINYGMDELQVVTVNGAEHINEMNNNINNISSYPYSLTDTNLYNNYKFPYRYMRFWYSGYYNNPSSNPTISFNYHSTFNSSITDLYVLKHLVFDINGHHYDGYYLAFDYGVNNHDGGKYKQLKPDGYYSNLIFKLTPIDNNHIPLITPETQPHQTARIMCEDLGNTNDFDFNDLAFDVYYTGITGNYTANITIKAVCGTLPIYLGKNEIIETNELHELCGGTKNITGAYNIILNAADNKITINNLPDTNPKNISIIVITKNATTQITLPELNHPGINVPMKIYVPITVQWTYENQQIETKYPLFRNWVNNQNDIFWEGDYINWDTIGI